MRDRDPSVALLLELIGGFFGLLGIGWIYAGQPVGWVILLIGYWLCDWIEGLARVVRTLGALSCLWSALNLSFGALSGFFANRWLEARAQPPSSFAASFNNPCREDNRPPSAPIVP